MTNLQVAYQSMLETKRANLARESETVRHNRASERLDHGKLRETSRHNVVSEGQQKIITDEQMRTNQANEAIKWAQTRESERHNLASEAEMERANMAKEAIDRNKVAETVRSNVANEEIKRAQHILSETLGWESLALDERKFQSTAKLQEAQTDSESKRQDLMTAQKWQAYAGAANSGVNAASTLAGNAVAALRGLGFSNLARGSGPILPSSKP